MILRRRVVVGEVVEDVAPYCPTHRIELALDRVLAPDPLSPARPWLRRNPPSGQSARVRKRQ
jgi:hypothetical protein